MNRRRIAIGVSSISGLAVVAAGAMSVFSSGNTASAVDLHATPVAAVTAAGAATRHAGTAQLDTLITISVPAQPAQGKTPARPAQTETMHGTGLFDFGKQVGRVDLTLPDRALQEILTPESLYMRSAVAPPTADTSAKGWTRVDTGRLSDGNVVSGGATDPALAFAMLAGAQSDVKYAGQDKVRGVPVAHYQGTLDLKQAANAPAPAGMPAAEAAADKAALAGAAKAFNTSKIPFDAYLDGQGRLRRFVGVFSVAMSGPGKPVAQVTSATELFGFGTPVTVVAPSGVPVASGSGSAAATGTAVSPHGATTPSAHPSSPTGTHK